MPFGIVDYVAIVGLYFHFLFLFEPSQFSFYDKPMKTTKVAFPLFIQRLQSKVQATTSCHKSHTKQNRSSFCALLCPNSGSWMRKLSSKKRHRLSGWLVAARHTPAQFNPAPSLHKTPRDRKTCQFLPIHARSLFKVVWLRAVTGSDSGDLY